MTAIIFENLVVIFVGKLGLCRNMNVVRFSYKKHLRFKLLHTIITLLYLYIFNKWVGSCVINACRATRL